jgi:hypothetical protein
MVEEWDITIMEGHGGVHLFLVVEAEEEDGGLVSPLVDY